jgi:rubrerythrin
MAPECFSGTVTLRSDVYALGIVFYELLSAQPPFHSDSLSELERLQRDQPINLAPLKSAGVPECLTHIIERATQKDAKLRPRSARHIAELITHTSEGRQAEKEGELEFRKALSRVSGGGPANAEAKGDAVTYYDHLSKRALAKKSRSKQQSVDDAGAPDAPDADAALAQRADQIAGREKTPASFPSIPVIPCPACGYNRRGVPPNVPCPECGFLSQIEPKPSDAAAHSVQPDSSDQIRISPSQVVPKSLLCIHCNYDLRGVSPAVACPECGEPLAKSLSMQRLIFADPHRVRRIYLGATVIAVPLLFNAFVFPMLPSALVKNSQPFNPTLAWLELGLAVVAAIGAVLLTPTRVVASSLFIDTLGWFIRVLSIVALGLPIALIAAHGPMPILIGSLMASQALFFCFVAAHTSAVAQRADDHKLVKHANSCSSVWILTLAAAAIGFVLDGVRPPPDSANVRSDIGMMLVTSAIAVAFITALYQIGVLVRFCRTLKSCRANHVPPPHTWGKCVA